MPDDALSSRPTVCSFLPQAFGGFTLIEVLLVIVIVAVLAMVAAPSFTTIIASANISSNVNGLTATIELARSEAIDRNRLVIVCRTTDARAVSPGCSAAAAHGFAGNDWASGWLVFARDETDRIPGDYDPATDTLLRRVEADGGRAGLRRSVILGPGAMTLIAWSSNGLRIPDAAASAPAFLVDFRDPASAALTERARCVQMSVTGPARSGTVAGGNCDATTPAGQAPGRLKP